MTDPEFKTNVLVELAEIRKALELKCPAHEKRIEDLEGDMKTNNSWRLKAIGALFATSGFTSILTAVCIRMFAN